MAGWHRYLVVLAPRTLNSRLAPPARDEGVSPDKAPRRPGRPCARVRHADARPGEDLDQPSVVGLARDNSSPGRSRPSCRRSILGAWHSSPEPVRLPPLARLQRPDQHGGGIPLGPGDGVPAMMHPVDHFDAFVPRWPGPPRVAGRAPARRMGREVGGAELRLGLDEPPDPPMAADPAGRKLTRPLPGHWLGVPVAGVA
jgi:hypothetical protein